MPEISDSERARQLRAQMTAEIAACTCDWPVKRYRNMSGHPSRCPADALWRRFHLPTPTPDKEPSHDS